MASPGRLSISLTAALILLLPLLITSAISYGQQLHHLPFTAEAGVGEGECIEYEASENTIAINCDASFLDVVQTIDDPDILENTGTGEYILHANLEVADGITFEMTSYNT